MFINLWALVFIGFIGFTIKQRGGQTLRRYFKMEFFLCVIGMVMVVEGLPYFAFPEKMKFWVEKMLTMPESTLRRFGLVLMVTGIFLVYLGKN